MKRLQTLMAIPLLAGLLFVTGCDNDDEPPPVGPTNTPGNTNTPVNTATRTNPPAATNTPTQAPPTVPPTNTATQPPTAPPTSTDTPGGEPNTPTPTEEIVEPTATPTGDVVPAICGNEVTDAAAGEECDDGNNYGGDGCAANCTFEADITLNFGNSATSQSTSIVQTGLFALVLNITGSQVTTHGGARTQESIGADGFTNFKPGDVPIATVISKNQVDGVGFIDPITVPGLVCACIRGIELQTCGGRPNYPGGTNTPDNGVVCNDDAAVCNGNPDGDCIPAFGPGVSAAGTIGCAGLTDIDYVVAANSLTDETTFTRSGGEVPLGILNLTFTAIGTIADSGTCAEDLSDPRKGPDGIPCTDDDPAESRGTPSINVQTTGGTQAQVLNVNNQAGKDIKAGVNCGATPCMTTSQGAAKACEDLIQGNTGGLCLASAFAALDQPTTGDIAVPAKFCALAN